MTTPVRPESGQGPAHVVIIGAGMVGLSTAWALQEHGVKVTVLDRSGIAAGSSWGNAGWISPGLAIPLAEPSVIKFGVQAMLDPDSPLYVPVKPDPRLLSFLVGFGRRCTMGQWRKAMAAYVPINRRAFEGYDRLEAGGVEAKSHGAPIMAAFLREEDAAGLTHEIDMVREAGLEMQTDSLDGEALRTELPIVSDDVETAIRIAGQRFIDPGAYVSALAEAVRERGGDIQVGANVRTLRHGPGGITVELQGGAPVRGDAVVISTGAWLPELAKSYGVRKTVQAGRGYSFSIPVDNPPVPCPVYFPHERVACTPIGDRLRVGGTMEFRGPDEPLHPERVEAIVKSASPLLSGVDWNDRKDVWVGSRPVTVDGLPLIGATKAPGVWVAGGHGMWGITLGPISGQLLAEQMMTGVVPETLKPFNPLR